MKVRKTMAQHLLKADTIHLVADGLVGALIESEIQRAMADITDRPNLGKDRKIGLTIAIKPVIPMNGPVEEVWLTVASKLAIPPRIANPVSMGVKATGALVFQESNSDAFDQNTLDFPRDEN